MKILPITLFIYSVLISQIAVAEEQTLEMPVMKDARVFYQDTEKRPFVTNFYTRATKQAVIDFYQQQLGEVLSQELKRGRLTLNFSKDETSYRVVISEQNNMRQVDIIAQ